MDEKKPILVQIIGIWFITSGFGIFYSEYLDYLIAHHFQINLLHILTFESIFYFFFSLIFGSFMIIAAYDLYRFQNWARNFFIIIFSFIFLTVSSASIYFSYQWISTQSTRDIHKVIYSHNFGSDTFTLQIILLFLILFAFVRQLSKSTYSTKVFLVLCGLLSIFQYCLDASEHYLYNYFYHPSTIPSGYTLEDGFQQQMVLGLLILGYVPYYLTRPRIKKYFQSPPPLSSPITPPLTQPVAN